MLKIIGGKHRGRALEAPEGQNVRPTSSRAREALFNILAHASWHDDGTSPLIDTRVLDAFAGSGALGLEALSRGAAHVTFLDNDARSIKLIGENIAKLGEVAAGPRALRSRLPRSALPLGPRGTGFDRPDRGRLGGARRDRHGRTRPQRGPRAARRGAARELRDHRRAPLWRGEDRDPAPDVVTETPALVAPLYLLRHGETQWNTERRMQGTRNSDLTERGRAQAAAMGRALARELALEERPTIFLRSPLGRVREIQRVRMLVAIMLT